MIMRSVASSNNSLHRTALRAAAEAERSAYKEEDWMNIKEIEDLENVDSLEKIKLKIDFERIKIEKFRTWLTAVSILIPLLLGVITVFYGVWSENERAKTNFQIKAVEIALGSESPTIAKHKAIVLYELFPDRLPKDFADKMISLYP